MPNSITNRQMVFILFLTLTSISLIIMPKLMAESAGVGSWVTIMSTAVVFGIFTVVIVSLNNMFQGRVLFDYSRELVGKAGSYTIAAFYILYFIVVAVYLTSSVSNVLKTNFMLKTPQWATLLVSLPVFGLAAYKGITNTARLFEIYGFIFLITLLAAHFAMIFQGQLENIEPFYIPSETGRYFGAMKDAVVPFLGVEVLTVIPFTSRNAAHSRKTAFLALIGIGLVYVLAVESSIMMIGMNEIVHYNDALITALRQVELPFIEFLRRLDVLYLTVGFMGIFASIIIVYTAIVEYVCRVFPRMKRLLVVALVGLVIFLLGWIALDISRFGQMVSEVLTYAGLAAAAFIPILLFTIAKVKKRAGKAH